MGCAIKVLTLYDRRWLTNQTVDSRLRTAKRRTLLWWLSSKGNGDTRLGLDSARDILCYGHRGAPAERPENTIASFEHALACGVDAIETDIHRTRDGHLVIHHDDTGLRMSNVAKCVRDCELEEVQSWDAGYGFVDPAGKRPFVGQGHQVPLLETVLERFPDVFFNIDLKQPNPPIVNQAMELVKRLGATQRVRLTSAQDGTVKALRRAGYTGPTGVARNEVVRWFFTPGPLARRTVHRGYNRALQVPTNAGPLRLDNTRIIGKAHSCGWRVDFWTINEPDLARRLLQIGADGIMTDDPARIAPVVRAFRESSQ